MARSQKGVYRAFDFAYGVNPDAGGALQVVGGGGAASSTYAIICSPIQGESSDGKPCAISTLTPITIGGDSGIETVTPTSVSNNGLGQIIITAAFTYAHGIGAQVRSGSGGLQEAASYAAARGGGLVALDAEWFSAVGIAVTAKATLVANLITSGTAIWLTTGADVCLLDYSGSTGSTAGTNEAESYVGAASGGHYTAGVRLY